MVIEMKRCVMFLFFVLFVFSSCFLGFAEEKEGIGLELFSDKQEYHVGESINFTLSVENLYDVDVSGEISGKIIVGDVGYEIECFGVTVPKSQNTFMGLTPLTASFSNSNVKSLTTLYACGGRQMQSTKSYSSSVQSINKQSQKEVFLIEPFNFKYNYNGSWGYRHVFVILFF